MEVVSVARWTAGVERQGDSAAACQPSVCVCVSLRVEIEGGEREKCPQHGPPSLSSGPLPEEMYPDISY